MGRRERASLFPKNVRHYSREMRSSVKVTALPLTTATTTPATTTATTLNNGQQPFTSHLFQFIFFFQIYFSNLFLLLHIFSDGNLTGFAMTGNSVAATVSQPKGFKHPLNIFIFVFFFKYKRMIICWRFCFRCFTARVLSEWEKFGNAAGGFRDSSG